MNLYENVKFVTKKIVFVKRGKLECKLLKIKKNYIENAEKV